MLKAVLPSKHNTYRIIQPLMIVVESAPSVSKICPLNRVWAAFVIRLGAPLPGETGAVGSRARGGDWRCALSLGRLGWGCAQWQRR